MYLKAKSVICDTSADGRSPLYPGDQFEIDEKTGKVLVERGAAVEIPRPAAQAVNPQPQASVPGENPSGAGNAQNGPENANTVKGHLDGDDLQSMSFADLKALAKAMGIETGKIKSKAGMIQAITAVEVEAPADDDQPPVFGAQDVVDE